MSKQNSFNDTFSEFMAAFVLKHPNFSNFKHVSYDFEAWPNSCFVSPRAPNQSRLSKLFWPGLLIPLQQNSTVRFVHDHIDHICNPDFLFGARPCPILFHSDQPLFFYLYTSISYKRIYNYRIKLCKQYVYVYGTKLATWIIKGSLEVKLPTLWTDGKAEVARVREDKSRREKIREEKESEERRCRRAER